MNSKASTPSEFARETLKELALRKLLPIPENYAKVYQEVSGQSGAGSSPAAPQTPLAWADLIRELLRQLETPHKGITITRKREGLETVLNRFAQNPDALFEKLKGLQRSWASAPTTGDVPLSNAVSSVSAGNAVAVPLIASDDAGGVATPKVAAAETGSYDAAAHQALLAQLCELLAQSLESTLTLQPELRAEVEALVLQLRSASEPQLAELTEKLRHFWIKLELRGGDKVKIQEGLLRLLRLVVENVGELVSDDQWLHGQIVALQDIIANPADKRMIADAERNLRDAIIKQGLLQQSLTQAKTTLKDLMTTFIDRLGELSESTGQYHSKIGDYSQKIGSAGNLSDLGRLLEDIMYDTRLIQESALRSHQELLETRKQADEAETRIRKLEEELLKVSELVREDQLTGALNRRGLDETMDVELKRADRGALPLSVALIDIDNFKRLNDTMGHQAGDQALVHLTTVIKGILRPTDAVGRYGGEEFVIVLPGTPLDEGVETIQRLQRELTKHFFLHNNEKVLVTFSAGVALRKSNEDQQDLVGRADRAMYIAKTTGKNRVVAAE